MSKNNQWLSVKDLIEVLNTMPQDAKVVVDNSYMFNEGVYYATRSDIELMTSADEQQVMIGTNYNTMAL